MPYQIACEICGNILEEFITPCPYCASPVDNIQKPYAHGMETLHRVINLERGMPLAEQALARMRNEMFFCRKQGVKILTLIHGYGSSGKGGAIKNAVRQDLQYQLHQEKIDDVIVGEEFSQKIGKGRNLLRRFPFLVKHRDLNRANPGITIVVF